MQKRREKVKELLSPCTRQVTLERGSDDELRAHLFCPDRCQGKANITCHGGHLGRQMRTGPIQMLGHQES